MPGMKPIRAPKKATGKKKKKGAVIVPKRKKAPAPKRKSPYGRRK